MSNRFHFTLNSDGKVIGVADVHAGRVVYAASGADVAAAGAGEMRHDSDDWLLPPAGRTRSVRQDSGNPPPSTSPQVVRSAAEAKQLAMRRAGHRGWTQPPAPGRSAALMRFDGIDKPKAPKSAGLVSSAAEARDVMLRRGNG